MDIENGGEFRSSEDLRTGYISSITFINKLVEYAVVDDEAIFEGDIVLGTVEEMEAAKRRVEEPPLPGVEFAAAISASRFRWPDGVVVYTIDNNLPDPSQGRVRDALLHWEDNTNIRFQQRTNEANFIRIQPHDEGCMAHIGMRGGEQGIWLSPACTTGLFHEQSREDRDDHVQIVWENIQPQARHNFEQHISDGDDVGLYDYGSIMHYPSRAFAINPGQPTIIAPQPIGQRQGLSQGDIRGVNGIYPQKTELVDTSTNGPALAGKDGQLLLGWTGNGNLHLNFMRSSDGASFAHKVTLDDTSPSALSLTVFQNRYVVAWRGNGNNQLNVMQSNDGQAWSDKVTLGDTSESAPSLAVLGGKLFLAWRGVGNNNLNVMQSLDGQNWGDKQTLSDVTRAGPALGAVSNKLLLTWQGIGDNRLNLLSSSDGVSFSNKVTLRDSTRSEPSFHVHGGEAYLCWQGVGNRFLNFIASPDGTNWMGKITCTERCQGGPALGTIGERLIWCWTAPDNHLITGLI
jgi:astacin